MSSLKAPQPPPVWKHSPEEVKKLTEEVLARVRSIHDQIAGIHPDKCDFESVFVPLALAETELISLEPVQFYQNVSPSKELRDASTDSEMAVKDFGVEVEMRVDVFKSKKAALKNIQDRQITLTPEQSRLVEKMILDGTRAGLDLPEVKRNELVTLKKELSKKCVEFGKNCNEESGRIYFTAEELKGVAQDVIDGYETKEEDGKTLYGVTHKTPDIIPVFKSAKSPETRRQAYQSYEGRLKINVPLLENILELRRQISALLGYKTWADYVTEEKMVKSAKGVTDFLDELESKMHPIGTKDKETLLAMKKIEHEKLGLPFDGKFYLWDYRYYDRQFLEQNLDLDDAKVKEYFPVSFVIEAVLAIYQTLLSVKFQPVDTELWHPDAQMFSVWEKDAKDESGFVGYCHLDLFPRDAKYGHAAVWPLIAGYESVDGKRHYPAVAMVANLAKSTPNRPALMRHEDVVTFFHEMGHVFHGLLSKTRYARFHGTSVAGDFVEAPSQMLENWCWEPEVLKKMSKHYESGDPLPDALITKMIKSRYVNVGLFYLRQIFFAKFDIKVHTDKESMDYTKLWNDIRTTVSLVEGDTNPAPGQGTFAHITGGYDAGYYGYTYSLVFAADMYATAFKANPLDPATGNKYRNEILLPGGSREEMDSLKAFLGRAPKPDAFTREILEAIGGVSAKI